jgi:hypothetical protein
MRILWIIFNLAIAMIGFEIHSSYFWSVIDFMFSPIALAKFLICHELTLTVCKHAFSFFFQ